MTTRLYARCISLTACCVVLVLVTAFSLERAPLTQAQTVDELRTKIDEGNRRLQEIEKEIRQYQQQLTEVGAEKQTLQKAIKELDLSRQKIQTDIRATEARINSTDLEIVELSREITIKELEIDQNSEAVAATMRTVDELENATIVEALLSHESLTEVWETLEDQTQFRESLREDIRALAALRTEYERAKGKTIDKREQLDTLKEELSGQKSSLDQTRGQKDSLLGKTKNKESNYQTLLAEKKAAKEKFEKELNDYEAKLTFILNPASIPAVGSGVLKWPFEPSYMIECPSFAGALGNAQCLTQSFGDTAFARGGAYNGKGHNGIDFRAPVGTKITASLAGVVSGTGNTDAVPGCYSYGKWVLVRHANGLSTLYAHLSSISVAPGQGVVTGQLVGYSGATGYVTGPHLHFSVYATEGVKIQRLSDIPGRPISGCSPATIPVAGFEAYLNPLSYL